jgi:fructose-bisphosphate aldolase class II
MLLTPQQARAVYEHAATNRYAVLAVNADSPAAIVDCLIAAKACAAPIIVETSLWQLTGHSFGAGDPLLGMDRLINELHTLAASERFREVPVIYHTDHIKGPATVGILRHAMHRKASSISLDSSAMSAQENIATMIHLGEIAMQEELSVTLEMEAGVDDGVTPLEETRTLFGEVEQRMPGYLALWAPGVGTKHGLGNDLDGFSPAAIRAHAELASELAGRPIGIALHGSSGLTLDQLAAGVAAGVVKVNWSSESLLIRSTAAAAYFDQNRARLDPSHSDFKATAMDNGLQQSISAAYVPKVISLIESLGGRGCAVDFRKIIEPCR